MKIHRPMTPLRRRMLEDMQIGVAVQSVQKVSVSSSFKINTLEGVL